MTKLRNIGYLRFGSKIRQGFAVATPSQPPDYLTGEPSPWRFFYFFVFYKNIFSIWKFTRIYPAARQPGGQDGAKGAFVQKLLLK